MDDHLTALKIVSGKTLHVDTQVIETPLVECIVISSGRANPLYLYTKEITFTSQEEIALLKALAPSGNHRWNIR